MPLSKTFHSQIKLGSTKMIFENWEWVMGRSSNEPGEIEKTPAYSISLSEPERQCGRAKKESKNQSARSRSNVNLPCDQATLLMGPLFSSI